MRKKLRNNSEVAHYWAHKVQSSGRSSNMFFEGDSIYSYGFHFKMARHHTHKGTDYILYNSARYSSSTNKHQSEVTSAIPYNIEVFIVPNVDDLKDKNNLKHYLELIETKLNKASRARSNKEWLLNEAHELYKIAKRYKELFKVAGKIPDIEFSEDALTNIKKKLDEKSKKETARKKKENAKKLKEYNDKLLLWRKGELHCLNTRLDKFDRCRVVGEEIQTTRRCNAPIKEVIVALKALKKGIDVIGKKLGHYTINNWDNKTLTVGCHKFDLSEIEYLNTTLGI